MNRAGRDSALRFLAIRGSNPHFLPETTYHGFLMRYTARTYLCPVRGQRVTRLSVPDPRGPREFFAIVPNDGGRQYREKRDEALDVLEQVVEMVLHPRRDRNGIIMDPAPEPGEVRWSEEITS